MCVYSLHSTPHNTTLLSPTQPPVYSGCVYKVSVGLTMQWLMWWLFVGVGHFYDVMPPIEFTLVIVGITS